MRLLIAYTGGTLVTHGEISVGDLTSLLLYTVYVGSGLQMLSYVYLSAMMWWFGLDSVTKPAGRFSYVLVVSYVYF